MALGQRALLGLREVTMTRKRPALVAALCICIAFAGCAKSWEKAHKRCHEAYVEGRYRDAVCDCAESLRDKPDYGPAQELIQDVFRAAVAYHEERIGELKRSGGELKWDDIVPEYEALVRVMREIEALPTFRDPETGAEISIEFDTKDYSAELAQARAEASEVHYQRGLYWAGRGTTEAQRRCAEEFDLALRYTPSYKDADDLYRRCKKGGVRHVAVIPFADKSGRAGDFGALPDMIADWVVSDLINDTSARSYVEVVSRDRVLQAAMDLGIDLVGPIGERDAIEIGEALEVHGVLAGEIWQIAYTPPTTATRQTLMQKKDVVIAIETYEDESGNIREREIRGDVAASVNYHTRATAVTIEGSYKIVDIEKGTMESTNTFSKDAGFECEWATFVGEELALNRSTLELVKRGECIAPTGTEIVNEAAKGLSQELVEKLKDFAR
jgi:TolB-like protein